MTDQEIGMQPDNVEVVPADNLRDELAKNLREVTERHEQASQQVQEEESKQGRTRDEAGRFAKNQETTQAQEKPAQEIVKEAEQSVKAEAPGATDKSADVAPRALSAAAKARWNELPEEIRSEIVRREEDFHKELTRQDGERQFARQIKEVITPYMPIIQAEGGTPATAIKNILNTAYQLRTATPKQKGELIMQIAQQYGAELPQPGQQQTYSDPEIAQLRNELNTLRNERQRELQTIQQREQAEYLSRISAFAADPKNVHFEAVRVEMAALLANGRAENLQEAYDKAIWADPEIRSTLLQQERALEEAKRVADAKAKADAAKKAAGSITGGPGIAVPNTEKPERSLREELRANLRAHTQ